MVLRVWVHRVPGPDVWHVPYKFKLFVDPHTCCCYTSMVHMHGALVAHACVQLQCVG